MEGTGADLAWSLEADGSLDDDDDDDGGDDPASRSGILGVAPPRQQQSSESPDEENEGADTADGGNDEPGPDVKELFDEETEEEPEVSFVEERDSSGDVMM